MKGENKMIESKNLSFSYGSNLVLDSVEFTAQTGKITYLAGENGCGKTTWIKCAINLLKQSDGDILFDGKPFRDIRDDFSICFDTPPMYKNMSLNHNLEALYGVDYKSESATDLLLKVGIDARLSREKAGNLSFGQQHRIGIVGSILRNPKYLILDEPNLGLDPHGWDVIKNKIINLKENGSTIILTGQNFHQVEEFADDIVLLYDKKIREKDSIAGFINKHCVDKTNESLENAFKKAIKKY